jgi:hypothetical protein
MPESAKGNINPIIGRGRRGPTPRRIAPTAIGCSGNARRVDNDKRQPHF